MTINISKAVYECISFKKGELPNFDKLKSMFIDNGLFINNKGESPLIKPVPDYISFIQNNIDKGNILSIQEKELQSKLDLHGKVGQITSEYELMFESASGVSSRFGVNLFQIIQVNDKWLITSMCWDDKPDKSLIAGLLN